MVLAGKSIRRVEERHPLKQGLKLLYWGMPPSAWPVEERHPLKQGLKHLNQKISIPPKSMLKKDIH